MAMAAHGTVRQTLTKKGCAEGPGGSRGCEAHGSQAFPGAHNPFSYLTRPPCSGPAIPPFIPRSSRVSKGKGPRLFSCYFSSIWSPQQTTPDRHEGPVAPGLSNPILGKGDSASARPNLLSLLLLELDFIRKAMEGGQGVPRNYDCSWSLSTLPLISQGNIHPSGLRLRLSHGTVCWIFPVRTYPFSPPCPTLSTEVLGGNAALTAFSGQRRGPGSPRWTCHSLHSYF